MIWLKEWQTVEVGFCPPSSIFGVLFSGVVMADLKEVGFCPVGFCPVGFCPVGFCIYRKKKTRSHTVK